MKTIAIVKREFSSGKKGGLEKVTNKIVEALQSKADVTLLTEKKSTASCTVVSYTPTNRLNYRRLQAFDAWCKAESSHYDVVFSMDRCSYQTHHRAGNGVHAAYLDLRRKNEGFFKSVSFAFNPLHRTILQLERATFEDRHLRKLIVNSHLVKNQILNYYGTAPEKIEVIHNGVEWNEMEADFSSSFPRASRFELLFIGHNFKRKGLLPLLKALGRVRQKEYHLSVVGYDKNLSFYERKAAALNIPATFYGEQNNTRPFYQKADVVVIPSLYDPFANVTVEALAMGLFVVSSQNNGGSEILTPSSGIVFSDENESLVAALESAFHHPKTLVSAQQIRNSVRHLDYQQQMEKIEAVCLT